MQIFYRHPFFTFRDCGLFDGNEKQQIIYICIYCEKVWDEELE